MKNLNKINHHFKWLFEAVVVLTTLSACAGTYGNYRATANAEKFFNTSGVLAEYHYYYTGSNVRPVAILAIRKSYTLTSEDLWNKMDIADKDLRYWVSTMNRNLIRAPFAYDLTAPDGNQIGFLYTAREPGPLIMEGDKRVSVYLPDDNYDRLRQIHN